MLIEAYDQLFIGGKWHAPSSDRKFAVYNPATREVIAEVAEGDEQDVARAVAAARQAFEDGRWANMPATERTRLLFRLGDLIKSHAEELARLECRNTGRPIREMMSQMSTIPEWFYYFGGMTDKIQGDTIPFRGNYLNYTLRVPVGVVGQITPWNHPLRILCKKLSAALAAGNTVVVKPSEFAPLTALELGHFCAAAGLPDGAVNIVPGFGACAGAALVSHPGVAKIDLTGGTGTGRAVARAAAENLARVTCELGGKAPVIFFEDVNLDEAVAGAMFAAFVASGQSCVSGTRLLVHSSIYDGFLEALKERTRQLRMGNPLEPTTQIGPVISQAQLDRIQHYVETGLQEGAKLLVGGNRPMEPGLNRGYFYTPTVFYDVSNDMTIAQEEIFGPVTVVIPFSSEDEVVRIANDVPYGLGASVWTNDIKRAHSVAHRLRTGVVWINDHHRTGPAAPWGGFKLSGYGRENGFEAMLQYTEVRSVLVNLNREPFDWYSSTSFDRRLN
ncbi:MAG: aldehyde dehydrogenase [Ardenticatenaceae bacterium]|nr:aldehyde dehydrogenase [Ardenticatenaceae bacterium]